MAASPSFSLLLYLLSAPLFSDEALLCYFKNLSRPRAIRLPPCLPIPTSAVASAHPPPMWPPPAQEQPGPSVPTSAIASSRPRAARPRALTVVASAAIPSSVLLPNGCEWESSGGLFSIDFVGLYCKAERARHQLGVSYSRSLLHLLSTGKPALPSLVKAVLHLERAGHSLSPRGEPPRQSGDKLQWPSS